MEEGDSQEFWRPRRLRYSRWLYGAILCAWPWFLSAQEAVDPVVDADAAPETRSELMGQNTITSSKSEVQILEDGTVADALQRRPDLRFNNVMVDGQESNVSLASMSSAAVDKVEVLKAVTPDVDADSLGGSVAVRSKPAFEQARRTVQGRLVFEMDSDLQKLVTEGTLTLGKAFGPKDDWGALFTIRGEDDHHGNDNSSIDWISLDDAPADLRVINRMRFDQWRDDDQEVELTGVIDHRVSGSLSLFVRGNFIQETGTISNPGYTLRFGDGTYVEADDTGATIEDGRAKRTLMAFDSSGTNWTAAAGGFYVTENIDADFRLSYESSDYLEPDFFVIDFEQEDVDLSYALADRQFPTFQQNNEDTLYQAEAFTFQEMVSEIWSHDESDLIGNLNVKVTHGLGSPGTGFWKAGAKVRWRNIDQVADSQLHDGYEGDYRLSDVVSDYRDPGFWDGRYRIDPIVDWKSATDFRDANIDNFVLNERRTREISDPGTYDAAEQITAGYGMGSFETGSFRLLAGLRYEQTDIDYTGREVVIDEDGNYESTQIRTGSSSYGNAFPSVHARYRFGENITLIASWTETIDRPPYRNLVPYRYVDRENEELEEGNPDLKPALLTNYDISVDLVIPGNGLLSLEAFSKDVNDFYYTQESIVAEGPYEGYRRFRMENGPTASILGGEITWSQELGSLHDSLSPFAFNINYLRRNTSITYPSRPEEDLALAGLPDEVLKLTVLIEKAWFFGQVELTRESDTLEHVGDVSEEDNFAAGRTRVDIDTTFEVMEGVKLIAELDNITSAYSRDNYEADPRYPTYLRSGAWKATLGVRWDL